jgi:hypothetical protein
VDEKQNGPFQLSSNASLKISFHGSWVTSDGDLILVRESDERLGFGELVTQYLSDMRRGKNTQLLASGGKWGYTGVEPEVKMEIPGGFG